MCFIGIFRSDLIESFDKIRDTVIQVIFCHYSSDEPYITPRDVLTICEQGF